MSYIVKTLSTESLATTAKRSMKLLLHNESPAQNYFGNYPNPFATLILDFFFFDLALVVTRRRRPRQQKVAQVSVTSCWWLADQGRKNELLGDSCWPAYGLSHTDDPLRHCPMHYATLLFFSFFFFFKVHIKRTSKEDQRQLLPVVKHLRTDGPQPIVLTSDADSQRLAAGGRPGADGSE